MIKAEKFYLWLIFFISLIFAYFIANRPENITADYSVYRIMYYNSDARMSEVTFNFFRYIFSNFSNGFIYLLYSYAFLSLFIKNSILVKQEKLNVFIFLIFYYICFFPLWEMTQIRVSLAISLFVFSFFFFRCYRDFIIIFSLLFHYSMVFLIIPYFLYKLFNKNIYISIFLNFILGFLILLIISYTPYVVYDANEYSAEYNIFSIKNFLIGILIIYNYINSYFENEYIEYSSIISLSILILYYIIGYFYPTIVIRLMDICVFLIISSLIFSKNTKFGLVLKYIVVSLVIIYYSYINYIVDGSLVNTNLIHEYFRNFF